MRTLQGRTPYGRGGTRLKKCAQAYGEYNIKQNAHDQDYDDTQIARHDIVKVHVPEETLHLSHLRNVETHHDNANDHGHSNEHECPEDGDDAAHELHYQEWPVSVSPCDTLLDQFNIPHGNILYHSSHCAFSRWL